MQKTAPNSAKKSTSGFTLIELLISVTLSIMLMLTATSLFMTFLIGSTKTATAKLVKTEGDFAMNQLAFLIRNAIEIVQVDDNGVLKTCENNMTTLGLRSQDGAVTILTQDTDATDNRSKIASNSSYLTSGSLTLINGPSFNCRTTPDNGAQYVTITFTLRKGTPGIDQPRDIVEQTFTSSTQVRSL